MTDESEQFTDGEGFRDCLHKFRDQDLNKIPLTGLVDIIVRFELVKNTSTHPITQLIGGPSPDYECHAKILDETLRKLYAEVERRERGF